MCSTTYTTKIKAVESLNFQLKSQNSEYKYIEYKLPELSKFEILIAKVQCWSDVNCGSMVENNISGVL